MFALRLKELRERRGLSQYGLADQLHCAQSNIGGWEAGTRETDFKTLCKLSDFFGVSVDYLIGHDSAEPTPEERAAGVVDTLPVNLTAIEDDLVALFREIGQKRGKDIQAAIITVLENMLK